jgi:hypothetical protein
MARAKESNQSTGPIRSTPCWRACSSPASATTQQPARRGGARQRYETGPMLITSNRSVAEWGTVFADPVVATAIDPLFPNLAFATARLRWINDQDEAAIALAKTLRVGNRAPLLAVIYASMGRYGEASDALMELAASDPSSEIARVAYL